MRGNLAGDVTMRGERMRCRMIDWRMYISRRGAYLGTLLFVSLGTFLMGSSPLVHAADSVAGRSLDEWSQQLNSPSLVAQRRAILSLAPFGKQAVPVLTRALSSEDAAVRYWAASALGDIGPDARPAQDALRLLHGERELGLRIAAAYALCRLGEVQEGLPTLLEGLKDERRGVWNSAGDFLARIGPPAIAAVPTLQQESQRKADHIADVCHEAIRRIQPNGPVIPAEKPSEPATPPKSTPPKSDPPAKSPKQQKPTKKADQSHGPSRSKTSDATPRLPNILWISAEDISPNLGCYGDTYAQTPNLDRFAAQGVRFARCFTHAGVCAISRSGLITGLYPVTIGSQHMRSQIVLPSDVKAFPEYLRAAGYWCTNRSKTDYNFPPPKMAWDENSAQSRDWRGRAPGQPFFSVINLTTTHESQIRGKFTTTQHDPRQAQLPPYIPDTPTTRRDWARYADLITTLDQQVADILQQLEDDGLAEETIVFFWGDHGQGLPRGKRWLYDSGLHVPLIIRWPERIKPGSVCDDLVCFLDFAPTMLRLAGLEVPAKMPGRVLPPLESLLAAKDQTATPQPREYLFGHRDRMDETYDLIRSVRDRRYKYLRNFATNRSYSQNIAYMNQMPTMQELRRLHTAGGLTAEAKLFFRDSKPVEELFDTAQDPHELVNLAAHPEHAERLRAMRTALERWQEEISDSGLIPEPLLVTPINREP